MNHETIIAGLKSDAAALLMAAIVIILSACSPQATANVPSDFYMMMDVHNRNSGIVQNINIRILANGKVEYDIYETGGEIRYDENDIVKYDESQIVRAGTFRLTATQLETLWEAIHENRFFELSDKYQMAIGHSYSFIMVEANGDKRMVDNIGMEVPELRALVETVNTMMPDGIDLEYGEGYAP